MAEDAPKQQPLSPPQTFADGLFVVLGLILVLSVFQQIPRFLQEHLGIDFGSLYLIAGVEVVNDTPAGTDVITPRGTEYYRSRSDDLPIGTFAGGTALRILSGPERYLQYTWRYVAERDAPYREGWVHQSDLIQSGKGGIAEDTPPGSKVRAIITTPLWKQPGGTDIVGEIEKGTNGVLVDGPRSALGSNWWFMDTEGSAVDGWAPEDVLLLTDDTVGWHRGKIVVFERDVDMFDAPGGGMLVGLVYKKTSAEIVGGPREVGGEYWWKVQPVTGKVTGEGWVPQSALREGGVSGLAQGVAGMFVLFASLLTMALLGGIIYATMRANAIRTRQVRTMRQRAAALRSGPAATETKEQQRWAQVTQHVASSNPNDWRLAIIEADVLLDELVARLPYRGTTLGERLKQATRDTFATLDDAWEAHKIRNRIAHDGTAFDLTQREAQKTIARYENVLREFHVL